MKALLVDDSQTVRNSRKKILATLEHSDVVDAAYGVEALKQIGETHLDLVPVD